MCQDLASIPKDLVCKKIVKKESQYFQRRPQGERVGGYGMG